MTQGLTYGVLKEHQGHIIAVPKNMNRGQTAHSGEQNEQTANNEIGPSILYVVCVYMYCSTAVTGTGSPARDDN